MYVVLVFLIIEINSEVLNTMTTMIHTVDYIAVDQLVLTNQPGGVSTRRLQRKLKVSKCGTMAMFCRGVLLSDDIVELLTWLLPKHISSLQTRVKTELITEDDFPDRRNYVSLLLTLADPIDIVTRDGGYLLFSGENDKDKNIQLASRTKGNSYFGCGGLSASALHVLTDDLDEIFKVVSLVDDNSSEEYDVIYRSDLKPMKQVV